MSLVEIATQAWGNAWRLSRTNGPFVPNVSARLEIDNLDGSPATVYAENDPDGDTLTGAELDADEQGVWPGWVEQGAYLLTEPVDGTPRRVEAVSAESVLSVESDSAALKARNLSGTGSPEGAVAASPGATYQQTNGVEGATLWVKETGTGNTGWRLMRRTFPCTLELFGPEPRAAHAMQGDALQTSYGFQSGALSASVQTLVPEVAITARLIFARWLLVWTPNATGCGVELIHADSGPTNITQAAEFTNRSEVTPLAQAVTVTSVLEPIIAAGARKFVGHRLKGDGAVGPLIYASRVELLFEG